MTDSLDDALLLERLRLLDDPEIGLNIVDLGMVRSVTHDGNGVVHVEITPTSASCPLHEQIIEGARQLLGATPGVTDTDIIFTYDPPWNPEWITPAGRDFLDGR